MGPAFKYSYTKYDIRPSFQLSYLSGEERFQDAEDHHIENVRTIKRGEGRLGLAYKFTKDLEVFGALSFRLNENVQEGSYKRGLVDDKMSSVNSFKQDGNGAVLGIRFVNY